MSEMTAGKKSAGNKYTKKLIVLLTAVVLSPFLVSAALADLRICNTTQDVVGVAVGYRTAQGWVSQGWWTVNPISCVSAIPGSLSSRFYYIYAETANGESRWEGPISMCIIEEKFEINGVSDCFPRGYQKAGFQEIDTGSQTSWMVQLSGTSNNPSITSSPMITNTYTEPK